MLVDQLEEPNLSWSDRSMPRDAKPYRDVDHAA
jgi:hypothetical protein